MQPRIFKTNSTKVYRNQRLSLEYSPNCHVVSYLIQSVLGFCLCVIVWRIQRKYRPILRGALSRAYFTSPWICSNPVGPKTQTKPLGIPASRVVSSCKICSAGYVINVPRYFTTRSVLCIMLFRILMTIGRNSVYKYNDHNTSSECC